MVGKGRVCRGKQVGIELVFGCVLFASLLNFLLFLFLFNFDLDKCLGVNLVMIIFVFVAFCMSEFHRFRILHSLFLAMLVVFGVLLGASMFGGFDLSGWVLLGVWVAICFGSLWFVGINFLFLEQNKKKNKKVSLRTILKQWRTTKKYKNNKVEATINLSLKVIRGSLNETEQKILYQLYLYKKPIPLPSLYDKLIKSNYQITYKNFHENTKKLEKRGFIILTKEKSTRGQRIIAQLDKEAREICKLLFKNI